MAFKIRTIPNILAATADGLRGSGHHQARRQRLAKHRPVVVMGRGKSGTRLLAWAVEALGFEMGTSPHLPAGDLDDPYFCALTKAIATRNYRRGTPAKTTPRDRQRFAYAAERLATRLTDSSKAIHGWGWKWPETYLIPELVYEHFPDAQFIHLARDGRDVAFKRHLTDRPDQPLGRAVLNAAGAVDLPPHLRAAHSWAVQLKQYRKFTAAHPDLRQLELSFETLCRTPVATFDQIAEFLNVPLTPAARELAEASVRPDQVRQYRSAPKAAVAEVERAIGATLQEAGYVLDHVSKEDV